MFAPGPRSGTTRQTLAEELRITVLSTVATYPATLDALVDMAFFSATESVVGYRMNWSSLKAYSRPAAAIEEGPGAVFSLLSPLVSATEPYATSYTHGAPIFLWDKDGSVIPVY